MICCMTDSWILLVINVNAPTSLFDQCWADSESDSQGKMEVVIFLFYCKEVETHYLYALQPIGAGAQGLYNYCQMWTDESQFVLATGYTIVRYTICILARISVSFKAKAIGATPAASSYRNQRHSRGSWHINNSASYRLITGIKRGSPRATTLL